MSVFKCKMCGGTLEINGGESVATCDYCGTQQTLPRTSDDVIQNLFNRANNLRLKSEFDKAEQLYEKILEKDNTEAEAHWGIVLCKYGIEYVEDPKTMERVPTCHRTLFDAVTTNADYLAAIEHSDTLQKSIYEKEARAIDEIQKDILKIAKNEEPFDVFICYKETDDSGKRTVDSTIANDIYYQLTREGLKVFYAAITLEDKLGQEYEPYIFAALNSSKVMLVLGTKPEYFTAVWVKNEWSRYLKLLKNDRSKMLIPCYRDMDAYELPEEFSHLQAQDMSKIGFMQDVIRGIKKVTAREENNNQPSKPQSSKTTDSNVESLLKRAFMFVEDGDFETAEKYCEKVLDSEPENTDAYLCKLMIAKKVTTKEKLKECDTPLEQDSNYLRILRTGDEKLVNELKKYNEETKEHYNETTRKKNARKRNRRIVSLILIVVLIIAAVVVWKTIVSPMMKYEDAKALLDDGKYDEAIAVLEELGDYEDSKQLITECTYLKAISFMENNMYDEAFAIFEELGNYKDSADMINKIKPLQVKQKLYNDIKETGTCFWGSYEQDNDLSNGAEPIEWLVLEVKDDKALVISKYALDCKLYNTSFMNVTWETCTLRKWLNSDFVGSAFSADEKSMISTVTVSADKNPIYITNPGNATQDQVFVLSITEANNYFSTDSERKCKPTDYAVAGGADADIYTGCCDWWLRTPGYRQTGAAAVSYSGGVSSYGNGICQEYIAVRPAMWIDLSKVK